MYKNWMQDPILSKFSKLFIEEMFSRTNAMPIHTLNDYMILILILTENQNERNWINSQHKNMFYTSALLSFRQMLNKNLNGKQSQLQSCSSRHVHQWPTAAGFNHSIELMARNWPNWWKAYSETQTLLQHSNRNWHILESWIGSSIGRKHRSVTPDVIIHCRNKLEIVENTTVFVITGN